MKPMPTEATAALLDLVSVKSSSRLIQTLEEHRASGVKRETVEVVSPGGEVEPALALYTGMCSLKFDELVTYSSGEVASAANVVFLAGDRRVASASAEFLVHPVFLPGRDGLEVDVAKLSALRALGERTGAPSNELMEVDAAIAHLRRSERQIQAIFVERSNLTLEQIAALMQRHAIMDASEALEIGIVHEIV